MFILFSFVRYRDLGIAIFGVYTAFPPFFVPSHFSLSFSFHLQQNLPSKTEKKKKQAHHPVMNKREREGKKGKEKEEEQKVETFNQHTRFQISTRDGLPFSSMGHQESKISTKKKKRNINNLENSCPGRSGVSCCCSCSCSCCCRWCQWRLLAGDYVSASSIKVSQMRSLGKKKHLQLSNRACDRKNLPSKPFSSSDSSPKLTWETNCEYGDSYTPPSPP